MGNELRLAHARFVAFVLAWTVQAVHACGVALGVDGRFLAAGYGLALAFLLLHLLAELAQLGDVLLAAALLRGFARGGVAVVVAVSVDEAVRGEWRVIFFWEPKSPATRPEVLKAQVPPMAKHPLERFIPFAKVDVAVVEVRLR